MRPSWVYFFKCNQGIIKVIYKWSPPKQQRPLKYCHTIFFFFKEDTIIYLAATISKRHSQSTLSQPGVSVWRLAEDKHKHYFLKGTRWLTQKKRDFFRDLIKNNFEPQWRIFPNPLHKNTKHLAGKLCCVAPAFQRLTT